MNSCSRSVELIGFLEAILVMFQASGMDFCSNSAELIGFLAVFPVPGDWNEFLFQAGRIDRADYIKIKQELNDQLIQVHSACGTSRHGLVKLAMGAAKHAIIVPHPQHSAALHPSAVREF